MANLYVKSTGSNTSPYDTWAKAATAPKTATDLAAAGDTIYQHAETFTIAADTTYSLASGVRWICTNDSANEPPQTLSTAGEIDGSGTSGVDITIVGGPAYIYGLSFLAGNSASATNIILANTDLDKLVFDNCLLRFVNANSSSTFNLGTSNSGSRAEITFINSKVRINNAGQGLSVFCLFLVEGGNLLDASSTVPTTLVKNVNSKACKMQFVGVDFSQMTSGTIFANNTNNHTDVILSQCKLGAATLAAAQSIGSNEYWLYDCSTTDTHYQFAHYAYNGSTTISTSIYANDGAEYNIAGSKHSWIVAGNANTTRAYPYISPWFSKYNEGTSAITPSIEILRNDSATAFTDIEVWGEFAAKTTSGFPISTIYNNYGGHLATGANQTAGMGLSSWTGESGTAWSGKLVSPSMTPAEIGYISSRVLVAGNHVVYVDPTIRGT